MNRTQSGNRKQNCHSASRKIQPGHIIILADHGNIVVQHGQMRRALVRSKLRNRMIPQGRNQAGAKHMLHLIFIPVFHQQTDSRTGNIDQKQQSQNAQAANQRRSVPDRREIHKIFDTILLQYTGACVNNQNCKTDQKLPFHNNCPPLGKIRIRCNSSAH